MVRPTRDPARYEVQSRTRRETWHHVCLTDYRGNGSCECEDFVCRKEPDLQRGAAPGQALRCLHIREAREHLLDEVIARLPKPQPTPR